MLDVYANQTLTWKHITSINSYNEPSYSSTSIKGRKQTGFKLVRNTQGEEVTSSAWVITESAVDENDLIDDRVVVAVNSDIDLNGTTLFYEVYLI